MNSIVASGISKSYGFRKVLHNVNLEVTTGIATCIGGSNGSGKSTLLKILSGLLTPDEGTISATANGYQLSVVSLPFYVGFVAPYLNVYDEFTPLELLSLQRQLHGEKVDTPEISGTLERVGLSERMNDEVRSLSSGLQQRVVLALAVHRQPAFLMLDEPTITLDAKGRSIVENEVALQLQRGGVVVIATNDEREKSLCEKVFLLD